MSNDAKTATDIINELEADNSRLQEKLSAVRLELSQAVPLPAGSLFNADGVTMLQGTKSSRYLLPVDYPPSVAFEARYGYSHPQIKLIASLIENNAEAYRELAVEASKLLPYFHKIPRDFQKKNLPCPGFFGVPINQIDTILLYTMMVKYRPKTYVEIGSGVTTCFANQAKNDHGLDTRIISIDPSPYQEIDSICDTVIRSGLETSDLSIFSNLEAGDIVFFDGSHRSFMNSDVTVFMLEVVPSLKPGVIVHVHDINLPDDYPNFFKYWYWNEQYMLAAYLMGAAEKVEIVAPTYWMTQYDDTCSAEIEKLLSALDFPFAPGGSFWFSKK